ncbi:MAG: protein kinase [Clostridia bacterium]|nr:protein kinase [Clostridia bacterium]
MEVYEKYVGAVLDGRYKIEKIIGIGGMAVVFKAFDLLMKRTVAVKMLKEEIADDEESVKRFVNESKAVAMMSHRNIVSIYDVNVREDVKYIAMEYVEGITLRNYMSKRGQLTLREIISYTEQILSALAHAHEKGIVHRDIKPQNILLLKSGIIKVTDFGIAKLPNAETVTMTDKAIGTVYYISPEQASGQEIDRRSDLYSLGVMMYEMATGTLPFMADSPVSVAMMQINDTAKLPSELNPNIPKGLEQIIGIAMEKNPEWRYQNAEDMLRQLHRLKENPNVVFRIPKHNGEEQRSIFSLLTGGGPLFPIIAAVALAFLIVFGIGTSYVIGKVMDAADKTGETITVDEFAGKKYDEKLISWFKENGNYNVTVNYFFSEEYEQGTIVGQDPQPNSTRKIIPGEQLCDLTLTVCSGTQEMTVPDLRGLDYRDGKKRLKALSLEANIEYVKSDELFDGQIVSSSPAAGEAIMAGGTVTINVCSGGPEGDVKVPDFLKMTEKDAFAKLVELELMPGKITYTANKAPRGTVIAQSEKEGAKVVKYTKINLTISGGKYYDPVKNPEGTDAPETTKAPETTAPKPVVTAPPKPVDTTAPEETTEDTTEVEETTGPEEKGNTPEDTTGEDTDKD